MAYRAASPAQSVNELDITNALAADDDDFASDNSEKLAPKPSRKFATQVTNQSESSEDEEFIATAQAVSNRKSTNLKGKTVKKGGGFQAMGLGATLLKAIAKKGFAVPTPVQRKTVPLILSGKDVLGAARTGSGKTLGFVAPMVEKLKGHTTKVGARALILSPSRELALQTLRVIKELGRGSDLRTVLLVGGDSLDEQFAAMTSAPDIIVATPGRFLHLKEEMALDLSSVRYIVFDEADRLFELGFAVQLNEILRSLPPTRQTMMFSATLPRSLVEFAKAGLQDPVLVRLDSERKISPDLQSGFFTVKSGDREGALMFLLDYLQIPTGPIDAAAQNTKAIAAKISGKKRKRGEAEPRQNESPTEHSNTIVFCSTKHHAEYLSSLLSAAKYTVAMVYGSLDQVARKTHIEAFRQGRAHILVTTDVAARGIDIPLLKNVIMYDFIAQPKVWLHRVGRTARAGQKGRAYSLIKEDDCPYLLDLQLFLGKRLIVGRPKGEQPSYAEDMVVGGLPEDKVSVFSEWITKTLDGDIDLATLRSVAIKGEKMYKRTRNGASSQSAQRAKQLTTSTSWTELHPLFKDETNNAQIERENLLARISGFRPPETIFEIGRRGNQGEVAAIVQKRRGTMQAKKGKVEVENQGDMVTAYANMTALAQDEGEQSPPAVGPEDLEGGSEGSFSNFEVTFTNAEDPSHSSKRNIVQEKENYYMSYLPPTSDRRHDSTTHQEDASTSTSFLTAARAATMDLAADESTSFAEPPRPGRRWDKRHKRYVSSTNDPNDGKKGHKNEEGGRKLIRSESGALLPSSFRSGRFDAWKKANRIFRLPRVGEKEDPATARLLRTGRETGGGGDRKGAGGKRYRHKQEKAPKEADKFRDDYHVRKKRVAEAKEKKVGKFREGEGKTELRGVKEMGKERFLKEKRRERTGRHKKGK